MITPDRWLADFETLDIKPEVRPKILKHNAARLLGLDRGVSDARSGAGLVAGSSAPPVTGARRARARGHAPHVRGARRPPRHLAGALRDLGVERGDRAAYLGPNDPTLLETLFAATALGGVFVPLNWRLTAPELTYIAADCGATVLVHAAAMTDAATAVAAGSTALRHLVELGPPYDGMATGGRPGGPTPAPIDATVGLDDPAVIIYTSGTTGRPKGGRSATATSPGTASTSWSTPIWRRTRWPSCVPRCSTWRRSTWSPCPSS